MSKRSPDATESGNPLMKQLAIPLVKLLAIPLSCQETATKWLVISNPPKSFWPGTRKTIAKWLVMSSKLDVELSQHSGAWLLGLQPLSANSVQPLAGNRFAYPSGTTTAYPLQV